MTTEDQIILRESWIKASRDLGFRITTPYTLEMDDGRKEEIFAFIPDYGRPNGTIIGLYAPPDHNTNGDIIDWAQRRNIFWSFISIQSYMNYDEIQFKETLVDWGYFGDPDKRPTWIEGFPNPWV